MTSNLQISSFSKNYAASKQIHPDEGLMLKTSAFQITVVTWTISTCLIECKSVRSKVVSIEGRFERQKSIRSKTRVSSIEDRNYCLSVLNLFIKSV